MINKQSAAAGSCPKVKSNCIQNHVIVAAKTSTIVGRYILYSKYIETILISLFWEKYNIKKKKPKVFTEL